MDMIRVSSERYISRDVIAEVLISRSSNATTTLINSVTLITKRGERISVDDPYINSAALTLSKAA